MPAQVRIFARISFVVVSATLALSSCTPTGPENAAELARLPVLAIAPSYVARITLVFKGRGIADSLLFVIPTSGTTVDTLQVRAGANTSITALAFDSSGLTTHRADTTVGLVAGLNPTLHLTLQPLIGTVPIQITFGTLEVILFETDSGGHQSIRRASSDGTGLTKLTPDTATVSEGTPVLRPGGRLIAFYRDHAGMWRMDLSGANRTLVAANGGAGKGPSWSADGSRIFYQNYATCAEDIYSVNADGTNQQLMVNAGVDIPEGTAGFPDQSIAGTIAFIGVTCGTLLQGNGKLYVINPDRSGLTMVLDTVLAATWSPDGTRLALMRWDGSPAGNQQIWVINRDGTGRSQLTTSGYNAYPSWSPDGTKIIYSHNCELHVMKADGSGDLTLLPKRGSACDVEPRWVRVG